MSINVLCQNLLDTKRKQKEVLSSIDINSIYNKVLANKICKLNLQDFKVIKTLEKINTIYSNDETLESLYGKKYNDKKILFKCLEDVNDEQDWIEYVGLIRTTEVYDMINYIKEHIPDCYFKKWMKKTPEKCSSLLNLNKFYSLYKELSYYTDEDEVSKETYINIKYLYNYAKLLRNDDEYDKDIIY